MNVMKTAIKIARCDYYQNEICKGFIECQDNAGVRQIPEPWNGDIENSKILILSSNPSYDATEEYYPAYNDDDEIIYDYFKNRFNDPKGKNFKSVKFWNTINKWTHWIECIEKGETNADNIIQYHKNKANESALNEVCISEVCHCKSTEQKCVSEYVDKCVNKHLDSVLKCFNGKYIIVVGSIAWNFRDRISSQTKAKVLSIQHPNAYNVNDISRINDFIQELTTS